ncbi:hypothetical protein [Sphaerisporangium sp. TRM90804]|uniref:hypothetical protein n=1 Tax=Sphaerisporangium sp. TRM90804 TaxID=3031113 RepID=UPI002446BE38|nr:hypothetical protein [Sphaerisporangium sp. TRM90804]MDH2424465.1 hypothetical protein [Sphaerisporangium sp. TRM90804]
MNATATSARFSLTAKVSATVVSAAVSLTAAIGLYAAVVPAADLGSPSRIVAGTTWDTHSDDDGTTWDSAKLLADGELPADDDGTTWD